MNDIQTFGPAVVIDLAEYRRAPPVAGSGSPPVAWPTSSSATSAGHFSDVGAAHESPMTAMHALRQADAVSLLADGRFLHWR